MDKKIKPIARREKLVIQNLDNETLVYDLQANKALCLNQTSALIWRFCNGNNDLEKIGSLLSLQTKSSVSIDLIWLALEQLKNENLIENQTEISTEFSNLSRREVIKRVGLASVIALPVIASIVAPTSAHAASCIPNDASCTKSTQCCSTCCKSVGGGANQCKPGGGACLTP